MNFTQKITIPLLLMNFWAVSWAENYVREIHHCQIFGYREDIDSPKQFLPHVVNLETESVFGYQSGTLLKNEFKLTASPNSTSPLPSAFATDLKFAVEGSPRGSRFFGLKVSKDSFIGLIRHLGGVDLEPEDPLEIEVGKTEDCCDNPWFSLFKWNEKYFLNFAKPFGGISIHAILPPAIKRGLSFEVVLGSCFSNQISSNATFSLSEPETDEVVVRGRGTSTINYDIALKRAVERATQLCKEKHFFNVPLVVASEGTRSSFYSWDASAWALCQ